MNTSLQEMRRNSFCLSTASLFAYILFNIGLFFGVFFVYAEHELSLDEFFFCLNWTMCLRTLWRRAGRSKLVQEIFDKRLWKRLIQTWGSGRPGNNLWPGHAPDWPTYTYPWSCCCACKLYGWLGTNSGACGLRVQDFASSAWLSCSFRDSHEMPCRLLL